MNTIIRNANGQLLVTQTVAATVRPLLRQPGLITIDRIVTIINKQIQPEVVKRDEVRRALASIVERGKRGY